jgi:RHS repeat-associated protein
LYQGLNLVTVAVSTIQSPDELFGPGSRVHEWNGKQYQEVASNAFVPVASPLWVEVPTSRIVVARGMYEPSAETVVLPPGPNLLAWPRLQPMIPDVHLLTVDARIHAHDPQRLNWFVTDPTLPVNVGDSLSVYDSASALWINLPSQLQVHPDADVDRETLFYHGDHLGSSSVMTDRLGVLVQEVAYFPFGEERNSHEPGNYIRQPYGFTGKEQDEESGLHYFEERYLAGRVGRFISVDPKYVSPDALGSQKLAGYLAQPQDLNLYAYSRNNPIRFIDPTGLGPLEWFEDYVVMPSARNLQYLSDNVWIAGRDDISEYDTGRSLKVGQGTVEVVLGGISCAPTAGAGCAMAAHGVDLLVTAAQDNDRTYTARGITALTGSETAGDVGDVIAGVGVGGAGLITKAIGKAATKLPGAGANAFSVTAKATTGAAKAEAAVVVSTTAKAGPRMQTLSGVGPYKATTAGENFGQRRMMQHIKDTPNAATTPVRTTGQYDLAQKTGRNALKKATARTAE